MDYKPARWNYDEGEETEASWLDIRKNLCDNNNKRKCCFLNARSHVSKDILGMLERMRAWSYHYETDCVFPEGVYPLAYVEDTLYFTDVEEYGCLDSNWARDHIYSVKYNKIHLNEYKPISSDFNRVIIEPGNNKITTSNLFNYIHANAENQLDGFMHDHKEHKLEIKYTDKHLKSQLGMIIACKFIKDFVEKYKISNYDISFMGIKYDEYTGLTKDDVHRNLGCNLKDDTNRDKVLKDIMSWCPKLKSIQSIPKFAQHYRDLVIMDTATQKSLAICPDGGFQNGWKIDACRSTRFYGKNCNVDSDIPLTNNTRLKFHIELE